MNRNTKKYLITLSIGLCAIGATILVGSECFAGEGTSTGRKIWDNIMLWLNFGILVFLFLKFAKNPLVNFLYGERNKIESNIGSVEEQLATARSLMETEADKLANIDAQLEKIKENIIEIGKREKEKIIENAKTAANQMISGAEMEAQYMIELAKKQFSEEMIDLATSMAVEKMLKGMSAEDNERIVDNFASNLIEMKEG